MIKFGSRTELYVPNNDNVECRVRIGDKVKAGDPLVKWVRPTSPSSLVKPGDEEDDDSH